MPPSACLGMLSLAMGNSPIQYSSPKQAARSPMLPPGHITICMLEVSVLHVSHPWPRSAAGCRGRCTITGLQARLDSRQAWPAPVGSRPVNSGYRNPLDHPLLQGHGKEKSPAHQPVATADSVPRRVPRCPGISGLVLWGREPGIMCRLRLSATLVA